MSEQSGAEGRTAFVMTHESDPNRKSKYKSLIALALTRSLGRRGIPVVRIHPNDLEYGLGSRYCTRSVTSPNMYESESATLEFLRELATQYPGRRVLIPASDDCAQFLGRYRAELDRSYEVCVATPAVMELIMNKQRQYEKAQEVDVPIPETYFPKCVEDFEEVFANALNYPYIIKPLVAHEWRLASMQSVSQGRKALQVNTAGELREAYESMGESSSNIMIQEVIGGRDQQLFTFLAYLSRDSTPLAYCVRKKVRQKPIDFGYCTSTVTCHDQTVVDQSIRLLQSIGFSGICGVEFKFDASTNSYKLIEINARPVNTIGISSACGVDIPFIAFLDLLGETVQPVTNWPDGVKWYQIWADFLAAREVRKSNGQPSMLEWWRSLRGPGMDAIYASDDKAVGLSYYKDKLLTLVSKKFQ